MSWEAEWPIARMPTHDDLASHARALAAGLGLPPPAITEREGVLHVHFEIPVAGAESIPGRLGSFLTLEQVRRDLDPPSERIDEAACLAAGLVHTRVEHGRELRSYLPGYEQYYRVPDHYRTSVTVRFADDDLPPRVIVFSNTDDNRAAWPVICDLGLAIARHFGIVDDGSDEADEDDLN